MHTITVTFEDREFEAIKAKKEKTTWHDLILQCRNYVKYDKWGFKCENCGFVFDLIAINESHQDFIDDESPYAFCPTCGYAHLIAGATHE